MATNFAMRSEAADARPLVVESESEFRVATACYRGADMFEAELERIFYTSWIYLGHESEVRNCGDFKATWIGSQPIILVRDEKGEVRAFFNICTHRGAALCREERGNAQAFVCPYHAWTFRTSGGLVGISDSSRYHDEFPVAEKGLRPIARVTNYFGLIFGSLSPDVQDFDDYLGEARKHVRLWYARALGGAYKVGLPHKYAYRGNWKFQAENVLDGYHANSVHGSAYRTIRKFPSRFPDAVASRAVTGVRKVGQTSGYPGGHGTVEAGAPLETGSLSAEARRRYIDRLVALNGQEEAQEILNNRHLLIFPGVVLMDNNIRVIQPIRHDYTEVYSYPLLIEEAEEDVNFARLNDVQSRVGTAGIVGADDIEIFNGNQTAVQAMGLEWITLSRGLGKEEIFPSGERIGAHSDETPQRAFWRAWQTKMTLGRERA